jgi:hypothetical protein
VILTSLQYKHDVPPNDGWYECDEHDVHVELPIIDEYDPITFI